MVCYIRKDTLKQKKPLQHKAAETFNRGSTLLERIKQTAVVTIGRVPSFHLASLTAMYPARSNEPLGSFNRAAHRRMFCPGQMNNSQPERVSLSRLFSLAIAFMDVLLLITAIIIWFYLSVKDKGLTRGLMISNATLSSFNL
ncbi:hypothetical protein BSK65_28080 [Paenibacillus odorifer]|uniref:Uncharacterized protein n=1 Tax=Paenibacillus odorifer TaxID=189426 RepID=A0A1R0Z8P9_9BACL|nr:hypothetical protein [Paenibacillus odorifer]OME64574.1 hypothetical protein BSK65_28080 [Paenibacillus odorifer]